MNPKQKSLLFWVVLVSVAVAVCMVAAISTRAGRTRTTVTYSEFLQKVDAGEVASVASQTDGLLKNGATVRTVLPADYRDALAAMLQKLVNIEIQESSPRRTLVNAAPFFLVLGVWVFLMFRMKNRPGGWGGIG
jgi:cell division protease FtsH